MFHQINAPCDNSMKTMAKLDELSINLLPRPSYSPDLTPIDYLVGADFKNIFQVTRTNEEVIAATESLKSVGKSS